MIILVTLQVARCNANNRMPLLAWIFQGWQDSQQNRSSVLTIFALFSSHHSCLGRTVGKKNNKNAEITASCPLATII